MELPRKTRAKRMTLRKWRNIRKAVEWGIPRREFLTMVRDTTTCGYCKEFYTSEEYPGCLRCPLIGIFPDSNCGSKCIPYQSKWMDQARMLRYCDDVIAMVGAQ